MNLRRKLILALGCGAVGWSPVSIAQAKVFRIGYLASESASDPAEAARLDAFRSALRSLGYVEAKNIVVEVRFANGKYERLPALAGDLVRVKVDALVTQGSKALLAAQSATATIPIVSGSLGDPVRLGVTTSFAHPSANVTGWSSAAGETSAKQVELLKEATPRIAKAAYLVNPAQANPYFEGMQRAADSLRIVIALFEVRAPEDLAAAFARMTAAGCDALFVQNDTMFVANDRTISSLALKQRLPSASTMSDFAEAGGLLSYGADRLEGYRRAAHFVDRIRKGAKVADLPIERASKFELVINTATAKSLGLAIPHSLASRARLI